MQMKSRGLICFGAALMLASVVLLGVAAPSTRAQPTAAPDPTRGAALYDNWFAVLGVDPPAEDMPIWSRQKTNTHSGEDTWRCESCHGWDYQGKDGAYRSGSYYTGFPGVYTTGKTLTVDEILAALKGQKDPQHDFSKYLDDASLNDLAAFIKTGLVDDNKYIDPVALTVIDGNMEQGKSFYAAQCSSCHGEDGTKITIRFNGRDSSLGTVAYVDPWRFMHKTRFGSPGAEGTVGHDPKWTPEQVRDALLYAKTLPNGIAATQPPPTVGGELPEISGKGPPGQSQSILIGIMTAFGAMFTGLGFAIILGAFLVGVIFVIVYSLSQRKK
jgi:mono/diheme cytochrome c family protein